MTRLGIVAIVFASGAVFTVLAFLAFVAWDRHTNDTPWDYSTISSRIVLLSVFWPIVLPMMIMFALPDMMRDWRRDADTRQRERE